MSVFQNKGLAFLTAMAIGGAGGCLAFWLNLPLAWMIGSMVAVTVASLAGVSVFIPAWLRVTNIGIIGVMLGATFTPDILDSLKDWWIGYLGLFCSILLTAFCCYQLLRRVFSIDTATAFYSSIPGGLSEMVLGGEEAGGNVPAISIIQATRILIIVMLVPFAYTMWSGESIDRSVRLGISITDINLTDVIVLPACLIGGILLARCVRLPSSRLLGPMLMSALIHYFALAEVRPPNEIVALAQIVVGSAIGARFSGTQTQDVFRYMGYSFWSTLVMAGVAAGMAFLVVSLGAAQGYFTILLGLTPGGLAEMSLIALSLNLEVPFVSSHHIVRIFLVVSLAPILFSFFIKPKLSGKKGSGESESSTL